MVSQYNSGENVGGGGLPPTQLSWCPEREGARSACVAPYASSSNLRTPRLVNIASLPRLESISDRSEVNSLIGGVKIPEYHYAIIAMIS